jgi:hypothetical protein
MARKFNVQGSELNKIKAKPKSCREGPLCRSEPPIPPSPLVGNDEERYSYVFSSARMREIIGESGGVRFLIWAKSFLASTGSVGEIMTT